MTDSPESIERVRFVLAKTLAINDRAHTLNSDTPILGGIPEFDSLAVVELIAALEQEFQIEIPEEGITAESFETVGSLAALVDSQLSTQ